MSLIKYVLVGGVLIFLITLTGMSYAATANPALKVGDAAGGALAGTYPNPQLANGAVSFSNLNAGSANPGDVLTTDGTNLIWSAPQTARVHWAIVDTHIAASPVILRASDSSITVSHVSVGVNVVTFPSGLQDLACNATLNVSDNIGNVTCAPGDFVGQTDNKVVVVTTNLQSMTQTDGWIFTVVVHF